MRHSYLALAVAAIGLSACTGLTGPVIMGGDAAAIYMTKPDKPPPPDLTLQIPPHQSWCYSTSGYAECYAHPQNVPAERLINVDPPSAYPLDLEAYHQALVAKPVVVALPTTPVASSSPPSPLAAPMASVAPAPAPAPAVVAMPGNEPGYAPDLGLEKTNLSQELNNVQTTGVAEQTNAMDAPYDLTPEAQPQPAVQPPAAGGHSWFSNLF